MKEKAKKDQRKRDKEEQEEGTAKSIKINLQKRKVQENGKGYGTASRATRADFDTRKEKSALQAKKLVDEFRLKSDNCSQEQV